MTAEKCVHEFRPIDSSGQLACIHCNEWWRQALVPSKEESFAVSSLRARFADESMPWTRSHVEGLINQIAELTKQRDEGWTNFYLLRKRVAEKQHPGLTEPVRAHETPAEPEDQHSQRVQFAKYHAMQGLLMTLAHSSSQYREQAARILAGDFAVKTGEKP